MELSDALEHFRQNHRAILATRRRDGRPQMSPVVQAVGNDGLILISTRTGAIKVRNIVRDPNVSICAISDAFFGKWAQVDGTASVIQMPAAMAVVTLRLHPDCWRAPGLGRIRARHDRAASRSYCH